MGRPSKLFEKQIFRRVAYGEYVSRDTVYAHAASELKPDGGAQWA